MIWVPHWHKVYSWMDVSRILRKRTALWEFCAPEINRWVLVLLKPIYITWAAVFNNIVKCCPMKSKLWKIDLVCNGGYIRLRSVSSPVQPLCPIISVHLWGGTDRKSVHSVISLLSPRDMTAALTHGGHRGEMDKSCSHILPPGGRAGAVILSAVEHLNAWLSLTSGAV